MWRLLLYGWLFLGPFAMNAQVQWAYRVHTFSLDLMSDWESARYLLGEPDKLPTVGKIKLLDDRPEKSSFLKVGFVRPVKANQVLVSGSGIRPEWIENIYLYDRAGKELLGYRAKDRLAKTSGEGGLLHCYLRENKFKTVSIKIEFAREYIEFQNLIDAVGITPTDRPWVPAVRLTDLYKIIGSPSALGPSINSSQDEILPRYDRHSRNLVFVRRKNGVADEMNEEELLSIWQSKYGANKSWSEAETMISGHPGKPGELANFCGLNQEGETIFLGAEMKRELAELDQRRKSNKPADGNTEYMLDPHTFSQNNRLQIVSRTSKTAMGKRDLYLQFFAPGSGWSKPIHMGPTVNSIADEGDPYLSRDGLLLFFSSTGFSGYGGRDIFVSKRMDNSWTNWSEPENLGPIINSPRDDAYFSMTSRDMVFFSSDRSQPGNMDLYQVKIQPKEIAGEMVFEQNKKEQDQNSSEGDKAGFHDKENPLATINAADDREARRNLWLSGSYFDRETGRAIRATIQTFSHSDPNWGMSTDVPEIDFNTKVGEDMDCELIVKAEGYFSENVRLIATDEKGIGSIHKNIFLTPIKEGKLYRLENIYFDVNSAILKEESEPTIDDWVEIMIDQPGLIIEVQGHTNDRCSQDFCRQLSRERSRAVVAYFRSKGVEGNRLHFSGFGSSIPVSSNDFEEGRKKNQRVEIKILKVR